MRSFATAVLSAALLNGCSLGGGTDKSGGDASHASTTGRVVTLRFATGDPSSVAPAFIAELTRASGGRVHVVTVPYDDDATDVDQRIAADVAAGRLDVADVAARAWESQGATGFRVFQTPFLITSDALLRRVVKTPAIVDPLLASLSSLRVTGLAVVPRGIRYLFAARRPLDSLNAFAGTRIRINESAATDDILHELHARADTTIAGIGAVSRALRTG